MQQQKFYRGGVALKTQDWMRGRWPRKPAISWPYDAVMRHGSRGDVPRRADGATAGREDQLVCAPLPQRSGVERQCRARCWMAILRVAEHGPSKLRGSTTVGIVAWALQAAAADWNRFTSTTKIQISVVTSGDYDITASVNTSYVTAAGGFCAVASGPGGNVYVEQYFDDLGAHPNSIFASNSLTQIQVQTTVLAHELGHVLNLAQAPNETSIMEGAHGGTNCPDAVQNHMPSTLRVQSGDAPAAQNCANKGQEVVDQWDNGWGESDPKEECWDVYWVRYTFTMYDDGLWHLTSTDRAYLYTTCGPPPY